MLCLEAAQTLRMICATNTGNALASAFGFELASGVETYKVLAQALITTANTTLYTVPSATSALIKSISIANTSGTAVTGIQLFVGGTAQANAITGTFDLPGTATAVYEDGEWTMITTDMRQRLRFN